MPTQSPLGSELKERYDAESLRLQQEFFIACDGLNYLRGRSALVESVVLRLAEQIFIPGKL